MNSGGSDTLHQDANDNNSSKFTYGWDTPFNKPLEELNNASFSKYTIIQEGSASPVVTTSYQNSTISVLAAPSQLDDLSSTYSDRHLPYGYRSEYAYWLWTPFNKPLDEWTCMEPVVIKEVSGSHIATVFDKDNATHTSVLSGMSTETKIQEYNRFIDYNDSKYPALTRMMVSDLDEPFRDDRYTICPWRLSDLTPFNFMSLPQRLQISILSEMGRNWLIQFAATSRASSTLVFVNARVLSNRIREFPVIDWVIFRADNIFVSILLEDDRSRDLILTNDQFIYRCNGSDVTCIRFDVTLSDEIVRCLRFSAIRVLFMNIYKTSSVSMINEVVAIVRATSVNVDSSHFGNLDQMALSRVENGELLDSIIDLGGLILPAYVEQFYARARRCLGFELNSLPLTLKKVIMHQELKAEHVNILLKKWCSKGGSMVRWVFTGFPPGQRFFHHHALNRITYREVDTTYSAHIRGALRGLTVFEFKSSELQNLVLILDPTPSHPVTLTLLGPTHADTAVVSQLPAVDSPRRGCDIC